MGGDGGCIPGRADMVRTAGYKFARNLGGMGYRPNVQVKAGDEHLGRNEEKRLRWRTCAATQRPLELPVATDRLGQLYSYASILERLFKRKTQPLPEHLAHLRGKKDLTVLKCGAEEVASSPGGGTSSARNVEGVEGKIRLLCCLQGTPLEAAKAIAMRPCGCAMTVAAFHSVRQGLKGALPELHSVHATVSTAATETLEELRCPACDATLRSVEADIIPLVPDLDKLALMRKALVSRKRPHAEVKKEDLAPDAANVKEDRTSHNSVSGTTLEGSCNDQTMPLASAATEQSSDVTTATDECCQSTRDNRVDYKDEQGVKLPQIFEKRFRVAGCAE